MVSLPVRGSGSHEVSSHGILLHDPWTPCEPASDEARLTIVQITDVYTLDNFASLKTLIAETKALSKSKVISVLTGDFLAPYLLSSVDHGFGMMTALVKTPIDYLTWGNHEADIDHRTVCQHVKNFPGIWLNTNMQDHEAMSHQQPFDIVEITSPDGTHRRRIGLIAVLSDDPGLYAHFKSPGAFGGANIEDPWQTLAKYKTLLEGPKYKCDLVIPFQHLYTPDDYKTCHQFNFPLLLGGHDHHRVDVVVESTRLLKPVSDDKTWRLRRCQKCVSPRLAYLSKGLDAIYATVVDICWRPTDKEPSIKARFVKVADWKPDPGLHLENVGAYDALLPLRNTELSLVSPEFEPLSSVNARGCVTSMGRLICSLIWSALNAIQRQGMVDAVLLMGGNIRGGTAYPKGGFFSLEALEAEIQDDEVLGIVQMPGWVLSEGVRATHAGGPRPGWMQYDIGVEQDGPGGPVVKVAGKPLQKNKMYRVATKISDLTNGQSPPFTGYYKSHPELLPQKGAYLNIRAELMTYFAWNVWCKLLAPGQQEHIERFEHLDLNQDGVVSVEEIHAALRDTAGLSVHDHEMSLARTVHSYANQNGDGKVTLKDFEQFLEKYTDFIRKLEVVPFSVGF